MKFPASVNCKVLCWLLVACLFLPVFPSSAAEGQLSASRSNLDQIQKQIEETLKGLRSQKIKSGALSEDLERLDAETRHISKLVKNSVRELSSLSERLDKQRQTLAESKTRQDLTEGQIRHRLVVLYKTGEVGLIRALLSAAESPRDIAEKYTFLAKMVRYDRELLAAYRQQSVEQRLALSELEVMLKEQSVLVQRRSQEQETLQRAQDSKRLLLAEVKQDAGLLEGLLQELRAKAARLNDLVKKLETDQVQSYTGSQEGLLPLKGRLFWPVPGKLQVGYGTSRHGDLGTLIESHGFDIQADVGTPVAAAAAGRVIFANTLRGYGKLIILDHGGKYYSLYAHVARFTKEVGEAVVAKEAIAYSGYEGRDAVYFEIRQGGKPLDPGDWLMPR